MNRSGITRYSAEPGSTLDGAVAEFFTLIVQQARAKKLLSDEHFTVDGTLIEAWAGHKSFHTEEERRREATAGEGTHSNNPTVNWRKEQRRNDTHESLTDPFARLFKKAKGAEAKLAYLGPF